MPCYGETVAVEFTALVDGVIVDSTVTRDPLLVTVGTGQVVPGFERALMALAPGQSVTVTVPAADAYGLHDPAKVHSFPIHRFRQQPLVGETIELQGPTGHQRVKGTVCGVDADMVWLDFNNPLAGKDVTFQIELVEVGVEYETPPLEFS